MIITRRVVPIGDTTGGTISRPEYLIINIHRTDIWYKIINDVY